MENENNGKIWIIDYYPLGLSGPPTWPDFAYSEQYDPNDPNGDKAAERAWYAARSFYYLRGIRNPENPTQPPALGLGETRLF